MTGRLFFAAAAALSLALPAFAAEITSSVDAGALPEKKRTPLGLYLTPADAHAALTADPGIVFLDVRDPIEIGFVGHPEGMDANVPVKLATHAFDAEKGRYKMRSNPAFVEQATAIVAREGAGKDSPVIVLCRSGGRSAAAARKLIAAGYTNVWNLVEGFEGDADKASGERTVNGWRKAGLPWSYKLSPEAAWQGAGK